MSNLPTIDSSHKKFSIRPTRTLPEGMSRWPKILFIGVNDWGNLANRHSRAINAYAGARISRVWTLERSPFQYEEDLVGPPPETDGDLPTGLFTWVRWGIDWIVTAGDGQYNILTQQLDALEHIGGHAKFLAVTHAGSAFRSDPAGLHARDWDMGAKVRFVGFDSMHLVPTDELTEVPTYPYWSPTDGIELSAWPSDDDPILRVCHSPSNREKKGTELILGVLNMLAKEKLITYDLIEGVSCKEAIERRKRCHIFVDQMKEDIGGFGCAAVEAMAVGCAVLGDVRNVAPSIESTVPPITPVLDVGALERELRHMIADRKSLHMRRHMGLAWTQKHASPTAVGERFLRILEAHR